MEDVLITDQGIILVCTLYAVSKLGTCDNNGYAAYCCRDYVNSHRDMK